MRKAICEDITEEQELKYLFEKFIMWRCRFYGTGYREVTCDRHSNDLMEEIYDLGYTLFGCDNPTEEGWIMGVARNEYKNTKNIKEFLIITDNDLDIDNEDRDKLYRDLITMGIIKNQSTIIL